MVALHRQSIRSVIRTITLLAALTSLLLTMVTPFVGTAAAAHDDPYDATNGALDDASFPSVSDACAGDSDTQAVGGTKLDTIHTAAPPVIDLGPVTPKDDLCGFWIDSAVDAHGDVWLYAAFTRASTTGTAHVALELLDSAAGCDPSDFASCNPWVNRTDGTRIIGFTWQGNDGLVDPTLWAFTGGSFTTGQALGSAFSGSTGNGGAFGEMAVNLSDAGILPNVNETDECELISGIIPLTLPGLSLGSQPKDVVLGSFPPINNCGSAEVVKRDAEGGNVLTGAHYTIYRDNGNGTFSAAEETAFGTCETGVTSCLFSDLPQGTYWAQETQAPDWYVQLASPDDVKPFTVTVGQTTTVTFVNRPIPLRINVTPDTDTNPVGMAHRFTVTIEKDPQADGTWVPVGEAFEHAADPGPGQFGLAWSGVAATVDTAPDGAANPCADGTDANGTCVVDVTATETGAGSLLATLMTPYQASTTPNPVPNVSVDGASIWDRIDDDGAKAWRGYDITVDTDATNLLGTDHTFTVSVSETGPNADTSPAGVVVVADWSGPAGSGVSGDTAVPGGTTGDAACTTDADGDCTFAVTSPDGVGTGTLTVTAIAGSINGHALVVDQFPDTTDITMQKTWKAYRLVVTPDQDINQVGWQHDFTVTVEETSDGVTWSPVEGATFADGSPDDIDFAGELGEGDLTIDASDCLDGTAADGTCVISATSAATGTTTLTVSGVTVPFDDDGDTLDDHLALTHEALSAGNGTDDNVGQKTWVDYGVTIGDDGVNLVGDAHDFTVSVTRSDVGELPGATVDLTWAGPVGSIVYPDDLPGSAYVDLDAGIDGVQFQCTTDEAGECAIEVDSDTTAGLGTLSVTGVTDGSGEVSDGGSITFELGEKDTTKEWVAYDVDLDGPAINLAGDDHPFTVTATMTGAEGTGGASGTVLLEWDGPVGSSVSNGTDTGTVGASGDPVQITCALAGGTCTITVDSAAPGTGTLRALSITDGDFTVDLTSSGSGQSADLSTPVETAKTWIAVDVDVDVDAVNVAGDPHVFDVTAVVLDGDGTPDATPAPVGSSLTWTLGGDLAGTATVDTDCGDFTTEGACAFTVDSSDPGTLTITLDELTVVFGGQTFVVDLTAAGDGQAAGLSLPVDTSKTWIDYGLAITPQEATNLLPTSPDHDLTVTLSSTDAVNAPVGGQTLSLTLTSDNAAAIDGGTAAVEGPAGTWTSTGTCTTDGAGQCDVTITTDTPGHATLSASYDVDVDGEPGVDATITSAEFEGPGGNGQDADKTWTTYRVVMDAPAVNLLGTPHTFTVTVERTTDGTGWDPVEGVVFSTDAAADTHLAVTAPAVVLTSDVADADTTCLTTGTDADGACTVTITSPSTTVATLTAQYQGAEGEQVAVFTADTTKTWMTYDLDVTPDTADNLVDTTHVFTVTVQVDFGDGEGLQPLPGVSPTFELGGVGSLVGETCSTGTDADGRCTVTITSSDAGTSTLTAEYEGVATDGEITNEAETDTFTDAPAVKNWVDYDLVMTEDAVNPIGTTHLFTATLTVDTGDGFGPAADETVDFAIAGVGEVVEVVDGTVDADGRGGTCTTDATGACDIVIASDVQGATTVTATYGAVVGQTSRDFSDDAVKTWVSNPAIDLVKDVDATELPIGGIATYAYTITNTGDVTLTDVQLVDEVEISGVLRDLLELLGFDTTITLEPGESTTVTSVHLVTEDDLPGPIDNVATVTGTAPDGERVSDTDDETVAPFAEPAIALDKVVAIPGADPAAPSIGVDPDAPGDTVIPYEFTVTNTGNVTLTDVTLTDIVLTEIPSGGAPTFDQAQQVDGVVIDIELDDTTLAPAESTTGTLLYQVRAADVDNAVVVNVAEVTGTDPAGTTVSAEDPAFVSLVFPDVVVEPNVVARPAPALPATGIDTMRLALWAALVAGLGAMLLLGTGEVQAARRRRD